MSKRRSSDAEVPDAPIEDDGFVVHSIRGNDVKIGQDMPFVLLDGMKRNGDLFDIINRINDSVSDGRLASVDEVLVEFERLLTKRSKSTPPATNAEKRLAEDARTVDSNGENVSAAAQAQGVDAQNGGAADSDEAGRDCGADGESGADENEEDDSDDEEASDVDDDDDFDLGPEFSTRVLGGKKRAEVNLHALEKYGLPVTWIVEIRDGSASDVNDGNSVRAHMSTLSMLQDVLARNGIVKHIEKLIVREWDGSKSIEDCAIAACSKMLSHCCVCQSSFPRQAVGLMTCAELFCQFRYEEATEGSMALSLRTQPEVARLRLQMALATLQSERPFEPFPGNFVDGSCAAPDRGTIEVLQKGIGKDRLATVANSRQKQALIAAVEKAYEYVSELCNVLTSKTVDSDIKEKSASAPPAPAPNSWRDRKQRSAPVATPVSPAAKKERAKRKSSINLEELASDAAIERRIGVEAATALRFLLAGNRTLIIPSHAPLADKDASQKYLVAIPPDQEERFQALRQDRGGSFYVFHGSRAYNWYSILCNGVKNTSNSALMTTGAVHGAGIYSSPNSATAMAYSQGDNLVPQMLAVCEVAGKISDYTKTSEILVIPDERALVVRMLIAPRSFQFTTTALEAKIRSRLSYNLGLMTSPLTHADSTAVDAAGGKGRVGGGRISNTSTARLMRDVAELRATDCESLGFEVEPDDDSLSHWDVRFFNFDATSPLSADMRSQGHDFIHGRMEFPADYPFSPPFVRIISPRFVARTGHVTYGGSICAEFLVAGHGWTSSYTITTVLMSVRDLLCGGGGRLDPQNKAPYSDQEARAAFTLARKTHGWD
eukprot:Opistho-2@66246